MDNTIIIEGNNGSFTKYTLDEYYKYQQKLFQSGQLTSEPTLFKNANDYYKEAGQATEVFNFFMSSHIGGRPYPARINITQPINNNELDLIRKGLEYENPIRYFSTLHGGSDRVMLNQERALARCHAYFIESYDKATDTITYINPWNSALTYKMPLKDLVRYLSRIDLCYA